MLSSTLADMRCFFFAHMYEKIAMRVLNTWYQFEQCCTRLLVYFGGNSRVFRANPFSGDIDTRALEERLVWSCIKAEAYDWLPPSSRSIADLSQGNARAPTGAAERHKGHRNIPKPSSTASSDLQHDRPHDGMQDSRSEPPRGTELVLVPC